MRKIYVLIFVLISANLFSQSLEVEESKKALLFKGTASWCGPCGYYHGVTDEIYNNYSESILFLNGHVATSSVGDNYSGDMHNLLNGAGGIPSYSLSGVHLALWPPTVEMILEESEVFFANPVIANIAFNYEIVGNELTVNTTTKFFQDASADNFYVGAMLVENNILVNQKVDDVYEEMLQHRIQRTVLGELIDLGEGKKLWADEIATGAITAGTSFDHSLSATLNNSWDVANLELIVVVWQRTGVEFRALSSEDVPQIIDAVSDEQEELEFSIFPNPCNEVLTISMEEGGDTEITIIDNLGRVLKQETSSTTITNIDVSQLEKGVYFVKISNANKTFTKSLLIQ